MRLAEQLDAFLDRGAVAGPFGEYLVRALRTDEAVPAGTTIGPYRILKELGRGGMAIVYHAQRADGTFRQDVAIKLVKRGTDTEEVLQRFRQERQILAALQHPHIARLLDGGLTGDGRPYFAMELVEGVPIDEFCRRQRLGIDARIDLCIAVARAVQHAHRHLVVHRDLKPPNILITATGEPKLLDFGIAKLLDPGASDEAAPQTRTALRLMTPDYASPEQVRGEPITTSSDVYQMGLLLFELLTGRPAQGTRGLGPAAAERVICDDEAPAVSAAVTSAVLDPASSAEEAPFARARAPEQERRLRRLRNQLRGDIDAVVATALRKAPLERYRSIDALLDDLERYRHGRPVAARGRSWHYHAAKYARRHWGTLSMAAATMLLLTSVIAFYSIRLTTERNYAQREAATANQVTSFVTGLFEAVDPYDAETRNMTVRELVDRGAARIERDLESQPEIQSRLTSVLATMYLRVGAYAQGDLMLDHVLPNFRQRLGAQHPAVAQALQDRGLLLTTLGKYEAAGQALNEALSIREAAFGPEDSRVADTLDALAVLNTRTGKRQFARQCYERELGIREKTGERASESVAKTLNNLGMLCNVMGDATTARIHLERARAIHESNRGPNHPLVAGTLVNLADAYRSLGDLEKASGLLLRSVSILRAAHGEQHRDVATALNSLANVFYDMKRFDEARAGYEQVLDIYSKTLGPEHPYVAYPLRNLGNLYNRTGDPAQSIVYHERALAVRVRAHGRLHPDVAQSLESVGSMLLATGDSTRAESMLRESLETARATLPADHERIGISSSALGWCFARTKRFEDAERLLLDGYRILGIRRGESSEETQLARRRLSALYQDWGRPADAARYGFEPAEPKEHL